MSAVPKNEPDSEDDSDYIPPAQAESESSDEEPELKRARTSSPKTTEEDEEARKQARESLWANFQASVDGPQEGSSDIQKTMVKIEKRYIFAGEPVVEVVDVPEDSVDAKKWPRWRLPEDVEQTTGLLAASSSTHGPASPSLLPSDSSSSTAPTRPGTKRPGPRKPRTSLAELPSASSQKARKLSTLDKSAMDWRAHVNAAPPDMKDELDANRRGGGYLEKVEFLKRVDERKDDAMEANKSTKRRR